MSQLQTLCASARGASHHMRSTDCEDASLCQASADGLSLVATVSDGVGDPACSRSAAGSRAACEAAAQTFLEQGDLLRRHAREGSVAARLMDAAASDDVARLAQKTVARWRGRVADEVAYEPLTDDEEEIVASNATGPEYLFACTHLAALACEDALLLMQVGDGTIAVMHADGTIFEPVEDDERCRDGATTALCEPDAAESYRSCVIDLNEEPVAAVFLSTDGVENSFDDTTGAHDYYRRIASLVCDQGKDAVEKSLELELANLSANGSADDCSLAVIVDPDRLAPLADALRQTRERHELEGELQATESKITSMRRKDAYLCDRAQKSDGGADPMQLVPPAAAELLASLLACLDTAEKLAATLVAAASPQSPEREEYRAYHERFLALDARRTQILDRLSSLERE